MERNREAWARFWKVGARADLAGRLAGSPILYEFTLPPSLSYSQIPIGGGLWAVGERILQIPISRGLGVDGRGIGEETEMG